MRSATSELLYRPVPIYSLAFLRICVGLLGAGDILGNGIYFHFLRGAYSDFTFAYYGFEWVRPLPDALLSSFFIVGFLLGLCVAFGYRFRLTAPLFAACFTYFFLLEKAHYLNHAYLFCWLLWMLPLTPAWRMWSLDVRRRPTDRWTVTPAWTVYLFPFLMGVVYFYGGLNKINHDWLVEAMPLHLWLKSRADMPLLGPLFALRETAYLMAWGGMLLDLLSFPLLVWRRSRPWVFALLILFHALNHLIFAIGIFPYLSLVLTSLFFRPDWPVRLLGKRDVPAIGGEARRPKWVPVTLLAVAAIHIALPLRPRLFTSDENWSEEGHRYSWRMMLRSKQGTGYYRLVDQETGREEIVRPRDSLEDRQYRKLTTHPDMILQYAHHLRQLRAGPQGKRIAIYGEFHARLNGRPRQRLVDNTVDLAREEWSLWGYPDWVLSERKPTKNEDGHQQ